MTDAERERLGKAVCKADAVAGIIPWDRFDGRTRENYRVMAEAVTRAFWSDLFVQGVINEEACAAIRAFIDAPAEEAK